MLPNVQMIGCSFLPVDLAEQRILISRRSEKKKHFPGQWETIGGNLEFGESFDECMLREVREEIGCTPTQYRQLHSRAMYIDGRLYVTIAYIGRIATPPQKNDLEISELAWIQEDEIEQYDFCPGDAEILRIGFRSLDQA